MRYYLLAVSSLACLCLSTARAQEEMFDYNLNSPYDTVVTHLGFLKKENYHPEIAAQAFSQKYRTKEEAAVLAIELQQLLEESRVDIDLSQVPQDGHYVDPNAKYHKYQLTEVFPEIYLAKVNNQWLYSEETAKNIPILSQKLYPFGIKELYIILPTSLKKSFLGIYLWQHVLLWVLLLSVIGVYKVTTILFKIWVHQFLKKWNPSRVLPMRKFICFILALVVLILALPVIQIPAALEHTIVRLLKSILVLAMTATGYVGLNVMVSHIDGQSHENCIQETKKLRLQLLSLTKPFIQTLTVLAGTLWALASLKVDISHMLAGLSIGGIGFALASQDTIKNFYGTLTILMDRPFGVGDTIVSNNIRGTVEGVGLRATRIRTQHRSIVYIPNAKLTDTYIDNYGSITYQNLDIRIDIPYNTEAALVEAFIEELRKKVMHMPCVLTREHPVYLKRIHNATLMLLLHVQVEQSGQHGISQHDQDIKRVIGQLAKELEIPGIIIT